MEVLVRATLSTQHFSEVTPKKNMLPAITTVQDPRSPREERGFIENILKSYRTAQLI
jgi:hypothetical protein